MSESCWSVYIIRCGDGSLYTGIATDVERRFGEHVPQGPKAAKYLRGRLPLEIVYRKEIGSRSEASKEELRIKRMGVKGKVGLVNGGWPTASIFPSRSAKLPPHQTDSHGPLGTLHRREDLETDAEHAALAIGVSRRFRDRVAGQSSSRSP